MRHLTRRIDELARQALGRLDESERLRSAFEHLVSIRGVGRKSAILLLGELAMLPSDMSVREWVAFAGLDPKQHRSGTSVEQRERISKVGNARIRRSLYMPALVAVQHEPEVRAFYEKLIGKGKKPRVALVAVMRKLLHAIYGMPWARPRLRWREVLPGTAKSCRYCLTFKRASNSRLRATKPLGIVI